MEGVGYELRWALDDIRCAGMPVYRMWMIGGATQSPLWPAILANITGVPLSLPRYRHWPAVGAAILAGLGAGAYGTLAQAQALFQKATRHIEPEPGAMSIYEECYASYQQLAG
jgi:xylulokinase